jgi:(4S)-4-hydroxy-5-phosphonooxypentane-2,3-dione isomerase
MLAVVVNWKVAAENHTRMRDLLLLQAMNSLKHEPDCHQFDICEAPDSPGSFLLYETYTDAAAFALHRETEHFATFTEAVTPLTLDKQVSLFEICAQAL